jgi:salicylate hydroxylase
METERHYEKFGGPYVQLHRADLQSALFKIASQHGVQVHTKSRVIDFDLDQPAIIFDDGRKVEADLVIAADGEAVSEEAGVSKQHLY